MINHARRGGNQIEIEFALQPFLDDLHVQKAQEAAAETIAQRHGSFGFKGERRVVEAQFFQRAAQVFVIRAIRRIDAAIHHGKHFFVARQGLVRRRVPQGDGVAHVNVGNILDGSGDVAHIARHKLLHGQIGTRQECAAFRDFKFAAAGHHADGVAHAHAPVHQANGADRAAIIVIIRIENQRLQGRVRVPTRRRHAIRHGFQHVLNADALLGRNPGRALRVQADFILNLLADHIRLRAGQIDFVDHRDDFQIVIQRHVNVGQRLRLNALAGVHHQ